jgi:hypothetical protein
MTLKTDRGHAKFCALGRVASSTDLLYAKNFIGGFMQMFGGLR